MSKIRLSLQGKNPVSLPLLQVRHLFTLAMLCCYPSLKWVLLSFAVAPVKHKPAESLIKKKPDEHELAQHLTAAQYFLLQGIYNLFCMLHQLNTELKMKDLQTFSQTGGKRNLPLQNMLAFNSNIQGRTWENYEVVVASRTIHEIEPHSFNRQMHHKERLRASYWKGPSKDSTGKLQTKSLSCPNLQTDSYYMWANRNQLKLCLWYSSSVIPELCETKLQQTFLEHLATFILKE